jgi:hypothetical protein
MRELTGPVMAILTALKVSDHALQVSASRVRAMFSLTLVQRPWATCLKAAPAM